MGNNVQCTGAGDAICSACHIGYFGSGTSECNKCEKMENCEYGCGHELGVSCDGANGEHIQEEGGEEDRMRCSTATDTKCGKCAPGYYPAEPNGEMDVCAACKVIDQCTKAFCTSGDDAICLECAFGYYPAGSKCAPVIFSEKLSLFTYEVGPTDATPEIFDDAGPKKCSKRIAAAIASEYEHRAEQIDPMDIEAQSDLVRSTVRECESLGCEALTSELGVLVQFDGCEKPKGASVGLLKML